MKLNRGKINHLSNLIIKRLSESGMVEFLRESNDVRLQVVSSITEELKIDDVVDEAVRKTINSYSKKIPEGSNEWEVMYNKLYDDEMKKRRGF